MGGVNAIIVISMPTKRGYSIVGGRLRRILGIPGLLIWVGNMARREIALEYKNFVIGFGHLAEIMGKGATRTTPAVDEVVIRCRGAKRTVYAAIQNSKGTWINPEGRPILITIAADHDKSE